MSDTTRKPPARSGGQGAVRCARLQNSTATKRKSARHASTAACLGAASVLYIRMTTSLTCYIQCRCAKTIRPGYLRSEALQAQPDSEPGGQQYNGLILLKGARCEHPAQPWRAGHLPHGHIGLRRAHRCDALRVQGEPMGTGSLASCRRCERERARAARCHRRRPPSASGPRQRGTGSCRRRRAGRAAGTQPKLRACRAVSCAHGMRCSQRRRARANSALR